RSRSDLVPRGRWGLAQATARLSVAGPALPVPLLSGFLPPRCRVSAASLPGLCRVSCPLVSGKVTGNATWYSPPCFRENERGPRGRARGFPPRPPVPDVLDGGGRFIHPSQREVLSCLDTTTTGPPWVSSFAGCGSSWAC